jgi:hypothetical protein
VRPGSRRRVAPAGIAAGLAATAACLDSWRSCRAGYLTFSEPYRQQAGEAARLGWPVREVPGGHLHMVVSPAEVAAAITQLAAEAAPVAAE